MRERRRRSNWIVEPDRRFLPDIESHTERFGIEDPRITVCGEEFMITYTGYSDVGPLVCLASTRDFRTYERLGVIMPPDDQDAALFPRTFDGRWALIHRPVAVTDGHEAHIWLSWSPDLRHWGDHTMLIQARAGAGWDAQGGAEHAAAAHIAGMASPLPRRPCHRVRLDLPAALRSSTPNGRTPFAHRPSGFGPHESYERGDGDVSDVVFPCGWVLGADGDTLSIYYGAADTSVCLATASLSALLDWLSRHSDLA